MSTATLIFLLIFGSAYAAYSFPIMLQFQSYCEKVAEATWRVDENNRLWNTGDGSNNAFQREVMRKLRNGEFIHYDDPLLVKQGHVLARKMKLSFWFALGLVLPVVVIEIWLK